jgi:anthranilate phosphoribosyltransferase
LGVSTLPTARKIAEALALLGGKRALVVCGAGHLDEVSLWGETTVYRVEDGAVAEETWTALSLGLPECRVEDLRVHSAEESAQVIRRVLEGETGPKRDIVVGNAAAALLVAGKGKSLDECVEFAREAIDTGQSLKVLEQLKRVSNSQEMTKSQ